MNSTSTALRQTKRRCKALRAHISSLDDKRAQKKVDDLTRSLRTLSRVLKSRSASKRRVPLPVTKEQPPQAEPAIREEVGDWDPDPIEVEIQATRCRALLLEIVKRAINDWVLYRGHSELKKKTCAREAYVWLFEEDGSHPDFKARLESGCVLTSFIAICEAVDLCPKVFRRHIKTLQISDVLGNGRPAERRRKPSEDVSLQQHDLSGVDIDAFEPAPNERHTSQIESHFAPNQLGYA